MTVHPSLALYRAFSDPSTPRPPPPPRPDDMAHRHRWQPVSVEKWITAPHRRVIALCPCGETAVFGVPDAAIDRTRPDWPIDHECGE